MIGFLEQLCGQGEMVCTYTQPIPANARVLFAEPHRQVVGIWTRGEELRVIVTGEEEKTEPAWLEYKAGKWEASDVPATEPAVAASAPAASTQISAASAPAATVAAATRPIRIMTPATGALVPESVHAGAKGAVPAAVGPAVAASAPQTSPGAATGPAAGLTTEPAAAGTQASPFSNPGMLPEEEAWWSEPGENFTTVWHYLPLSERNSQRLGFVVPTFVFDDEHAALNLTQRVLYILHDGHLIALPIPAAAFGKK